MLFNSSSLRLRSLRSSLKGMQKENMPILWQQVPVALVTLVHMHLFKVPFEGLYKCFRNNNEPVHSNTNTDCYIEDVKDMIQRYSKLFCNFFLVFA